MLQVGVGAVLREHQLHLGVVLLQPFDPSVDVLDFLLVPAEVTVHALDVGVHIDGMVGVAVAVDRGSEAVGVLGLGQVVERLRELRGVRVGLVNLVVEAPDVDGGMVVALADELAQLAVRVFPLLARHAVDEGNLGPDDEAQRVALGVDVVGLLVVGQADGCRADVHDGGQVGGVLAVGQGAAQSEPVLMARHAVHGILLPVQVEALARHDFELAQAERLHHLVDGAALPEQARRHLIKIGVLPALPQVGPAQREAALERLLPLRREVEGAAVGSHDLALGVADGGFERHGLGVERGVVELDAHTDVGRARTDVLLAHVDARRGVVGDGDVAGVGHDEPDGAVDAAVDAEEVMIDGDDVRAGGVVGADEDFVGLAELHVVLNLAGEGRVGPAVAADEAPVHVDLGAGAHTLEPEEQAAALPLGGADEGLAVVGRAGVEVVGALLHVVGVPRVGQADAVPAAVPLRGGLAGVRRGGHFLENPAVVKREDVAGLGRGGSQAEQEGGEEVLHAFSSVRS